jgi:hypothetical protein
MIRWKIFADVTEDMLHLKEQTDAYSTGRVYGSHFSQVKDLKAKTLIWDRNKFKEMHVTEFKKNNDQDAGIFYDDSYNYSFNFPSVSLGNRNTPAVPDTLQRRKVYAGLYFYQLYSPGKMFLYAKNNEGVELVYEVVNDSKGIVNFKKYEKGGFVFYEWSSTDLPARKNEEDSPSLRYFTPHIICYVKSYETKKGKVNVLSNLDDLYRWYNTFVKDLNKESSPELASIVEKIKASSPRSSTL